MKARRHFSVLFLLAYVALLPAARAEEGEAPIAKRGVYLGAGFFFQNALKVASGESAARSLLGEAYFPEIVMGYRFARWFPAVGYTPFGSQSGEGNKKRMLVRVQAPYTLDLGDNWEAKGGPGLLIQRIYGKGGFTELGNGGNTKEYYTPGDTRTLRLLYLAAGAAYLNENWRYDLDFIVTGLLSSRRAVSLSLGAGYVF